MSLSAKNSTPTPPPTQSVGSSATGPTGPAFAYPPVGSSPAAIAAYHQYYQQYYQYIYSMYNPTQAAAIMQAYGQNPAAVTQGYSNYPFGTQTPKTPSQSAPTPPPPPPQTKPTEVSTESKIKINIKFSSEAKSESRKSRFTESIANVIKEQESGKQQAKEIVQQPPAQQEAKSEEIKKEQGSDIVFDINKWPNALKSYCARVYQHYQNIKQVSEDQVTKYLQKRITDAFKIRADLNIVWDSEPLPDVAAIRQVAPLSQYQIEQQKRQQQLVAQQIEAKRRQIQAQQEQKCKMGLMATIKENMKRKKSRSRSRETASGSSKSTTSESDEDENFIRFKKSKSKNLKRKSDESDDSDEPRGGLVEDRLGPTPKKNGKKMSKKERRKFLMDQKRKEHELLIKEATYRPVFGLGRKIQSENNLYSLSTVKKSMKSIFELEREQDIEHGEALHAKNICIGMSEQLEKEYLRLTGPPDPSNVRPLRVLKHSLDYVLTKYQKTNDYRYICDQMKAIRQDLTVQQIRNEFTIHVYETHARIAIKNKDRDEFNQCQNQLKSLYNLVSSKNISLESYTDNSAEFIGYRLLYNMLTKSHKDIDQVIKEIKQKYSFDAKLKHLLELKQAWLLNNYVKFFKLYKKSNFMCKCLIEQFIDRERKQALKIIIKSYRPTIKLQVVSNMLAYDSLEACKKDLIEYKINLIEDNSSSPNSLGNETDIYIDCKLCNLSSF